MTTIVSEVAGCFYNTGMHAIVLYGWLSC